MNAQIEPAVMQGKNHPAVLCAPEHASGGGTWLQTREAGR